jgi:hypothetical protein
MLYRLAFTLTLASGTALASIEHDLARLGTLLTPLGAEMAGNAEGSIPSWNGGLTMAPAGYGGPGKHHVDPFASDQPLFVIDANNLDEHRAHLTPGQLALFAAYPQTFRMPVYVTRSTNTPG